ncbi:MAG TPA: UvrB/UvrC motif-containing protein [Planctomycetota bacterium]|nr:UvrB/UvrC motif-containing protein [Planctomycetota bacterium]
MGKLCQVCGKREAKIHFTEIREGKKTEMHICEQCAHEKNTMMAFPAVLSQLVKGGGPPAPRESEAVPATCPGCGLAYAEFKAKGRLGCPRCYEAFGPVLIPLLEKVHGASAHRGKTPERVKGAQASRRELADIEQQLASAVANEEYEKAAQLRDRLRGMKGKEP